METFIKHKYAEHAHKTFSFIKRHHAVFLSFVYFNVYRYLEFSEFSILLPLDF